MKYYELTKEQIDFLSDYECLDQNTKEFLRIVFKILSSNILTELEVHNFFAYLKNEDLELS